MKKLILLFVLLFGVLIVQAEKVSRYVNLTAQANIPKGLSYVAVATNVADFRVSTDSTKYVLINASQDYPSQQDVLVNMTAISGSPSVAITLQGKKFLTDSWTEVISVQTWTSTAVHLASTLPTRYRYYAVKFVCSTAPAWPSTLQFKQWFVSPDVTVNSLTDGTATFTAGALSGATTIAASGRFTGTGGATITGATVNLNASSNFATNIGTGSTDAAVTIGGGSNTVAINSSDWDISTTGIATNMGTYNGLTILNSIGRLVTTATADADSTVAGSKITAVDQFVTVTSGGATRCITLPAAASTTVGLVIEGVVGANGFDLRVATADAMTVKLNNVTGAVAVGVEAAIPATSNFRVVCVSATEWVLTATDEVGAVITAIIPDAIE